MSLVYKLNFTCYNKHTYKLTNEQGLFLCTRRIGLHNGLNEIIYTIKSIYILSLRFANARQNNFFTFMEAIFINLDELFLICYYIEFIIRTLPM